MVWAMLCHSGKANENASNAFWLCIGVHFCMLCTKHLSLYFYVLLPPIRILSKITKNWRTKEINKEKNPNDRKWNIRHCLVFLLMVFYFARVFSLQFLVVPKSILNMTRNINIQLGMKSVRLWFFHSSSLVGTPDWIHGWK